MDENYPLPSRPRKLTAQELDDLAKLESPALDSLALWHNRRLSCAHCKVCTRRCEILEEPGLDMGMVEKALGQILALPRGEQEEAVSALAEANPELYNSLRRCVFCGYCTIACPVQMDAPYQMRGWREPFMQSGIMPPDDSRLVMVDNEWHIFSAYRAIYGVDYSEYTLIADLAGFSAASQNEQGFTGQNNQGIDTLLFPGCSLVSYAPQVVKVVGEWLSGQNIKWALSLDCCGSPLLSAGLDERAVALREGILVQAKAAGIQRVLTICPGCGEELAAIFGTELEVVPLPEVLLEHAESFTSLVGSPESVTIFDSCHDRYDNRHGTALRSLLSGESMSGKEPGGRQANYANAGDAKVIGSNASSNNAGGNNDSDNNAGGKQALSFEVLEMAHTGAHTLCCGAGGAVASFDPSISERRVWRVHGEALESGAKVLATVCPTCTYTLSQAQLSHSEKASLPVRHYLELLYDVRINWDETFAQLEAMWSGEYGPWLIETFYS